MTGILENAVKFWFRILYGIHEFAYDLALKRIVYWLVLRKILSDFSGSHSKKLLDLSFLYNTNFVSITGKIYWPHQMFADLIAGPIEFVGKWKYLTIFEPCMSVWALEVRCTSIEVHLNYRPGSVENNSPKFLITRSKTFLLPWSCLRG